MTKNQSSQKYLLLLICLILALSTACNMEKRQESNIVSSMMLQFPVADYYALVNSDDGIIAFTWHEGDYNVLQYAIEGNQRLQEIALPKDARCDLKTDYSVDAMLPDGNIQILESCFQKTQGTHKYIWSYDWQTGKLDEIAGPLPLGTKQVSWDPTQARGVAFLYSGFGRSTMYWVSKDGIDAIDLIVRDGDRSWNLKNFFPNFLQDEELTKRTGEAGPGEWSPDGRSIVFFASPDAIGKTGLSRFYDVEYGLYQLDVEGLQIERILGEIYLPSSTIRWSPDLNYIAFIGSYKKPSMKGLWLFSIKDKHVVEIAQGTFQDLIWSADGSSLIAIACEEIKPCSIQRYFLDIGSN